MIIKTKAHWFKMLFEWKGSVLPQLLPRLTLLFIFAASVVYFQGFFQTYNLSIDPAIFTLFGVALAIFLGFRNSASYERWWEARKLWGALLNDTRSIARQSYSLIDDEDYQKKRTDFINKMIALVHTLRHQLRFTDSSDDLKRLLKSEDLLEISKTKYQPIMLLQKLAEQIKLAKKEQRITAIEQLAFEDNFNKISDIIGGCERIASTPIPYTYSVLLHRTVYLYCFLLPFGFVQTLGWMTPFAIVFIAYTFVALEAIADELEDPFGLQPNDLALDAMSKMIENTLLEIDNRPDFHDEKFDNYFIT
ncbi:bestrophin family protein [Flavobacterium ardleyense]|uniref:bestrophin family protein n=1 Tax=Flavobacterium ardleyense TaxID=2038737 RepID=UPI00298CD912|nr:bestrophin family ion channel [Flavobacterium ardleyense]